MGGVGKNIVKISYDSVVAVLSKEKIAGARRVIRVSFYRDVIVEGVLHIRRIVRVNPQPAATILLSLPDFEKIVYVFDSSSSTITIGMVRKVIADDRVSTCPECIVVRKIWGRYYAVVEVFPDVEISVLDMQEKTENYEKLTEYMLYSPGQQVVQLPLISAAKMIEEAQQLLHDLSKKDTEITTHFPREK